MSKPVLRRQNNVLGRPGISGGPYSNGNSTESSYDTLVTNRNERQREAKNFLKIATILIIMSLLLYYSQDILSKTESTGGQGLKIAAFVTLVLLYPSLLVVGMRWIE